MSPTPSHTRTWTKFRCDSTGSSARNAPAGLAMTERPEAEAGRFRDCAAGGPTLRRGRSILHPVFAASAPTSPMSALTPDSSGPMYPLAMRARTWPATISTPWAPELLTAARCCLVASTPVNDARVVCGEPAMSAASTGLPSSRLRMARPPRCRRLGGPASGAGSCRDSCASARVGAAASNALAERFPDKRCLACDPALGAGTRRCEAEGAEAARGAEEARPSDEAGAASRHSLQDWTR